MEVERLKSDLRWLVEETDDPEILAEVRDVFQIMQRKKEGQPAVAKQIYFSKPGEEGNAFTSWRSKTPTERLAALEKLRIQYFISR